MVGMPTLIVYIGSVLSLSLLDHSIIPAEEKDTLSMKDVYQFPILGSLSLFGLYMAFKHFDKDTINFLLSLYFCVAGVFAMSTTFAPVISFFFSRTNKLVINRKFPVLGEVKISQSQLVGFLPALIIGGGYFKTKHFMLNNVLGASFCLQALQKVSIGSYKIGAVLLAGLFFYDIFWVFGTDVMLTVATKVDGPIKLLFPRILPSLEDPKGKFSLLGLGDIVVPGLFVAIMFRLDAVRAKADPSRGVKASFPRPFLYTQIAVYALGLGLSLLASTIFENGQPALLYLVPACLLGSLGTCYFVGDWGTMFAYNEEVLAVKGAADSETTSNDDHLKTE